MNDIDTSIGVSKTPSDLNSLMSAEMIRKVQERTPARLFVDRAGASYRTFTQLELRQDHAAAVDAVHAEFDLIEDLGEAFVQQWGLFEVHTLATSKVEFLMRPDRGRRLHDLAKAEITRQCSSGKEFQVVIGDGLSASAVKQQVPHLLPLLQEGALAKGWSTGQPFFARHCRVGVMNDIGELLRPEVLVLLIGERPGLATAESLSAYMAFRPAPAHNDANRNLISNIHSRGVPCETAAHRILALATKMRMLGNSGVTVKEAVANHSSDTVAFMGRSASDGT